MSDASSPVDPEATWQTLQGIGLVPLTRVRAWPSDALPAGPDGAEPVELVLVGVVGSAFWAAFVASPEYRDGAAHPLDRWSRRWAHWAAERLCASALLPFGGPPHWPFQRWALRDSAFHRSPLGLLIHREHGLWAGFRFALALSRPALGVAAPSGETPRGLCDDPMDPCTRCATQACLTTCPVEAHGVTGFQAQRCLDHLRAGAPDSQCMSAGCAARRACPVALHLAHRPAHAAFLSQAFRAGWPDAGAGG